MTIDNKSIRDTCENISDSAFEFIFKPWETSVVDKPTVAIQFRGNYDQSITKNELATQLEAAIKKLNKHSPLMLTTRFSALNQLVLGAVHYNRFFPVECYLLFKHDLVSIPTCSDRNYIREFKESDLRALMDIAMCSFTYSRFHNDPELSPGKADLSRAEWVKNSCHGRADKIYVLENNKKAEGFVLCQKKESKKEKYGNLDLIAVKKDNHRKKAGHDLTVNFLQYCRMNKLDAGYVGTQAHNIPSVRLYEKAGFLLFNSYYSFHKHI